MYTYRSRATGDSFLRIDQITRLYANNREISFGVFDQKNVAQQLFTGRMTNNPINLNKKSPVYRVNGLISCAAVFFVNYTTNLAMVYHAPSGDVDNTAINTMVTGTGGVAGNVHVLMAHPGNDAMYTHDLNRIVAAGIPTHNVVHLPNTILSQFSIDQHGTVGF